METRPLPWRRVVSQVPNPMQDWNGYKPRATKRKPKAKSESRLPYN
jgi:hypothetical protein